MAWAADYCTVADLRAFMRISDALDDTIMTPAISAASRAIDRACDRQFGRTLTAEDRYYEAKWNSYKCEWYVEPDDIASTTSLSIGWDANNDQTFSQVVSDYLLRPRNALGKSEPITHIVIRDADGGRGNHTGEVMVHAIFGWLAVPDTIKYATMLQASRLVSRRDAPFGISGSAEFGGELRILSQIDADVAVLVKPFKRKWSMV